MELTFPHKHIKNIPTCGTSLTKTNWRLAEKFQYNQGCKKDPHGIRQEGREDDQVGICVLGWAQKEKGHYVGGNTP